MEKYLPAGSHMAFSDLMSSSALEKIRLEAESLTAQEKEQLIDMLSESLYSPEEIDAAWVKELERREKRVEAGLSSYSDWDVIKPKFEKYFEKIKNPQ